MANCPKCNAHLKITDWKQHCPHCGANIVVYDLQERLMQDADKAEVQFYHFQKKIDRLKASFIGSKLAIVRIFTSLLPVGALFLPIVKATVYEPLKPMTGGISALSIYEGIDSLGNIFSAEMSTPNIMFIASFAMLLLSLVLTLVKFVLITLACSPKGKVRNYTFDYLILALSVLSAVLFAVKPVGGLINGGLFIGAYLYILLQIANVAVDIATFKQGIPINHKQCYCGGIPIEEYFEMVDKGMSSEDIRQEQYARLRALQEEKERKLAEDEARKAAEEAAKAAESAAQAAENAVEGKED